MSEKTAVFLCIIFGLQANALFCKDDNNNEVDWFVAYKIPSNKKSDNVTRDGFGYIYFTSEDAETWKLSKHSIADESSILGNTLRDIYKDKSKLSYIMYNDEPPNRVANSVKGHTKGVVAADSKGGFWLVHSIPHFPELGESYTFPESGVKYGQSIMCISLDLTNINKVGVQLQYNQPDIYLENIVSNMESSITELAKAADNVTITSAPWYHVSQIISKNDVIFVSFAKHGKFGEELYVDLVAPYLKNDLEVETWPNGVGRLTSNCSKHYKVYNVNSIQMSIAGVEFKTTSDHSKWAVSSMKSKNVWSCVGDINRAEHQMVRGGGTVCLNNQKVADNFKKIIGSIEECSQKNKYYDNYLPKVLNL